MDFIKLFLFADTGHPVYSYTTILPISNMSTAQQHFLSAEQLQAVARLFSVLAEPTRLAVLQALRDGPHSVGELVGLCRMKQANVSKHLGILHDHHLVRRQRQGVSIRYEIADSMVFSLCSLVCGKMEKDARCAADLFHSGSRPAAKRR